MPKVQYVNMIRKIDKSASFPTPKRITELRYWLKACQVALSDIPRNIAESEESADRSLSPDLSWFVANSDIDAKWIKFNLENRLGEKAHIVIDRKFNQFLR